MTSSDTEEVGAVVATTATAQATRARGLRGWRGFAFVLPYLPLLIVFGILPMIYALDLAFTTDTGGWAGLGNFTKTVTDYRFRPAFEHILIYTGVWLTALVVFVVFRALLLHGSASRASSTFRFPFYIP